MNTPNAKCFLPQDSGSLLIQEHRNPVNYYFPCHINHSGESIQRQNISTVVMSPRTTAGLPSPTQRKQLEEMLILSISGLPVVSFKKFLQKRFPFILLCNQVSAVCLRKVQPAEIFLPGGGRRRDGLSQKEAATHICT